MPASTTMPRLTSSPASLASQAFGLMPAAMTTSVAGMMRAVGKLDALDLAVAEDRLGVGLGDDLDAARLDRLLQQVAGRRIELALHQVGMRWSTVTSMPRALSPAAASSPSRPPPITTAFAVDWAASSMALTSSRSR